MTYIPLVAINCTVTGVLCGRYLKSTLPQVSRSDLARASSRRHCAALSLRSSPLHSTQDRRHHGIYGCRQAIRRSSPSEGHQNLPLLLRDWSEVSEGHHDRRRGSEHGAEQQRDRCPTNSVTSPWLDTEGFRTQRYCGWLGVETHHHSRIVFQS
jgi:hypothetical protein